MVSSSIRLAVAIAVVLVLGTVGLALAKSKVHSSITAKAVESQSAHTVTYSGKVSSSKAGCKANRKVKLIRTIPAPPGFQVFARATTDGSGSWSVVTAIRPIPYIDATAKAKKLGQKTCAEATKRLSDATVIP